jgi:hypothetical protein
MCVCTYEEGKGALAMSSDVKRITWHEIEVQKWENQMVGCPLHPEFEGARNLKRCTIAQTFTIFLHFVFAGVGAIVVFVLR